MKQRSISYGEIYALGNYFDQLEKDLEIRFACEEQRDEALYDFIDQYVNGCDTPEIRVYNI